MKIIKKKEVFKKMPDSSLKDIKAIDEMINMGWSFCSKKEYKSFNNIKEVKEVKEVETSEKEVKKRKKVKS